MRSFRIGSYFKMKGKKLLVLLLTACIMTSVSVATVAEEVFAARPIMTRIQAVEYKVEDILASFAEKDERLTKLDGQSTYAGGRKVEYRLYRTAEGEEVDETDESYKEAAWKELTGTTVEFLNTGYYEFKLTWKETTPAENEGEDPVETDKELNYIVTVNKNVTPADEDYNKTSVTYKALDNAAYTDYLTEVAEHAENLKTGDSYSVHSLETIVDSRDFAYNTLQKTVYYCAPNSKSFTSGSSFTTTSPSFTVSEVGTYSFYVLFKDVFGNAMTTDTLKLGEGGWYKTVDNEGKEIVGDVVIPVFTFEVTEASAPTVSVKASDDAYLDLEYEINCFNITAENYKAVYKLYYYYNATDKESYFKKDDYATDAEYLAAVKAAATDITEDYLDADKLTFTPDKVGYYYVEAKIVDGNNLTETVLSRPIRCLSEVETIKRESEFFKNNLTSIILLGVAALCLVGIILLLVIKPKESNTVEVKEENKQ